MYGSKLNFTIISLQSNVILYVQWTRNSIYSSLTDKLSYQMPILIKFITTNIHYHYSSLCSLNCKFLWFVRKCPYHELLISLITYYISLGLHIIQFYTTLMLKGMHMTTKLYLRMQKECKILALVQIPIYGTYLHFILIL